MTSYVMSQIAGSAIPFKPTLDVLLIDIGHASDLLVAPSGSNLVLSVGGASITLQNVSLGRLTTSNVTFSDGSQLLVGDNTTGTSGDKKANVLVGTEHDDQLVGLGGNDSLDGAGGSDTYLVLGTGDGTDTYHDTGATGIDRIIAGSDGAIVRLTGAFSAASRGIEEISANGFANVDVLGSAGADVLDFAGMTLTGLALIDAGKGHDTIVGSAGADVLHGGAGNDAIDGGVGLDVVMFDGTKDTYSVIQNGDVVVVTDLARKINGNDGTDTLRNVEVLRFLDGDVALGKTLAAVADTATATEDGGPVAIDVLANDSGAQPSGSQTVVSVNAAGLLGAVAVDAGGTGVTYDVGSAFQSLKAGATADETFSYTIQDGSSAQSTANVTVTVTGVNDGPNAVADNADATQDGGPVAIDVLANDTDPDAGDNLTVVAVNAAGLLGAVAVDAGGTGVTYDVGTAFQSLKAGETANETFSYTIQDGSGAQSTASVTVTVTGVNDGPTAVADTAAATEDGGPVTIDVLANDFDVDNGDALTVTAASVAPGQGSVSIINNMVEFDPGTDFAYLAAGESVDVLASYSVQDSSGALATSDITITVTGTNGGSGGGGAPQFTVIDPAQADAGGIINAILGSGPGLAADPGSLSMTAGPSSVMFYDGSLAPLGIGPGLLLTSGTVPGTSNTVGFFGVDNGMPGDPALDAVVNTVFNTASYDATTLSFTFTVTDPTVTGIRFNAVFGSDEYPEWVDAFVDIGVVLVNGVNVAYFNNDPMAPLSVIGSNLSASYFNDNTANLDTSSFGGVAVPGVPSTYPIEYDGISNVLSILAPVHLGVNTIEIGIADTGDHIYDSGLFISNLLATDVPTSGVVVDVPCTEGNDSKNGSSAAEIFDAKGGDDSIYGNGGNDVLLGGLGNDLLDGGANDDVVNGGDGTDTIVGGAGDDNLDGGTGIDIVSFSGNKADYQVLQIGVDEYQIVDLSAGSADGTDIVSGFESAVFADGSFDLAALIDTSGPDGVTIFGTAGDDIINETVTVAGQPVATALGDVVYGGEGDDIIATGDGNDTIFGDAGNDQIDAGAGSDLIVSGPGHDELLGGLGADRFVFGGSGDSLSSVLQPDQVLDFNSADGDKIDFSQIDAITGTPENDAFTLVASFSGAAGELVVANAGTEDLMVMGDVNGDMQADFGIVVTQVAALNANDFLM